MFFVVAWLYTEAFLLKRDAWSFLRAVGFGLASLAGFLHAAYAEPGSVLRIGEFAYLAGIIAICASNILERLPPRPKYEVTLGGFAFATGGVSSALTPVVLGVTALALLKRYLVDVERLSTGLFTGFFLLAGAATLEYFSGGASGAFWLGTHLVKAAGYAAIGVWIWRFLSLRLQEEALIVFVSISLLIALFVTTTFSIFFLDRIEREAETNLVASARIFTVHLDSLRQRSLAVAQIIGNDDEFGVAVAAGDLAAAETLGAALLRSGEQDFLIVADETGRVLLRTSGVVAGDENVLAESVAASALAGRPAVAISESATEGFSIRASAPIRSAGNLLGILLVGVRLDEAFLRAFKNVTGFETTLVTGGVVRASTVARPGDTVAIPRTVSLSRSTLAGADVIAAVAPVDNEETTVAIAAITTTPGELVRDARGVNLQTMAIIFLVTLAFILPLYRFTTFLQQAH